MNFESIDIFKENLTIKISNRMAKYGTKCGAILTLVCLFTVGMGIYIFGSNFLDTKTPRITIDRKTTNDYPNVNLHKQKFIPPLGIFSSFSVLHSSLLLNFTTPMIVKIEMVFNNETKKGEFKILGQKNLINSQNSNLDEDNLEEFLEKSGAKDWYDAGFILTPDDMSDEDFWNVEGSANYLPYTFISIILYPCSLPNPDHCAPVEQLILYDFVINFIYLDHNLSKKYDPLERIFGFEKMILPINPMSMQLGQLNMKRIRIFDEDKDFIEPKLSKEYFTLGDIKTVPKFRTGGTYCDILSIANQTCIPYAQVMIKSGSEAVDIYRTYPKLFSIISELGGFGDLIFILIGFFYSFYLNYSMKRALNKELSSLNKNIDNGRNKIENIEKSKSISEKELMLAEERYIDEKLSGANILKQSCIMEGFSLSMVGPSYRRVLEIIPLLEKMFEEKNGDKPNKEKGDKNQQNEKPKESRTLMEEIDYVLQKSPTNEFELAIKKN